VHHGVAIHAIPGIGNFHQGRVKLGFVLLQLLQQQAGGCNIHSGVPQIATAFDVLSGGRQLWLLNKLVNGERSWRTLNAQLTIGLDVSKCHRWRGWLNADGDDFARCSNLNGLPNGGPEYIGFLNNVVCSKRTHDYVRFALGQNGRRQNDSRGGVFRAQLENQVLEVKALDLLDDGALMSLSGNNEDAVLTRKWR